MVDIENLELLYFCNGTPVPYKLKDGGNVNIYPILVKDKNIYDYCAQILQIKKNEINDIEVIQMSYLEFLLKKVIVPDESRAYQGQLYNIFRYCLHENNISFCTEDGKFFYKNNKICIFIFEDDWKTIKAIITPSDFDDISKIILFQNDPDYDDRYLSPEVREIVSEYYKLKYKDINIPKLEKQKAFVISKTGMTLNEINNMTCRMFTQVYSAGIDSEIYIGEKIIQGSEKYLVKEDIIHPIYSKKKDLVEGAFTSAEKFEQKIKGQ